MAGLTVLVIDTSAPAEPQFALSPTSDTGVAGDDKTTAARVTLVPSTSSVTVGDTVAMQVVVEAVDGERVRPQPGGFYGGWVSDDVLGPFKGEPGTEGW